MGEISPDLKNFVAGEVNGNFSDQDAVIDHALRLMQRDREEAVRGIETGLEDIAAGRVQPLDEAFDDLRQKYGVSKDA